MKPKNNATFGDLHKIQDLDKTLRRFDNKLATVCNERRKQLFDWFKKWTPKNDASRTLH